MDGEAGPAPAGRPAAARRLVEVAVDVPGHADETYTYLVPDELAGMTAGEAVLVEFGRRQALGIVLGDAAAGPGVAVKPIAARVRTDGPLLPPLQLALVRRIARHYLAPPAVAIRAALPPGLLERLELVAFPGPATAGRAATESHAATDGRATTEGHAVTDGRAALTATGRANADPLDPILERVAASGTDGVGVRALPWAEGRAALLRGLREAEARGAIGLEWRLTQPHGRARQERRAALTATGRAVAASVAGEEAGTAVPIPGELRVPRLGPRQRAALARLSELPVGETIAAVDVAGPGGSPVLAGLARRGLVELSVAEHARRPLEGRPAGPRGPLPSEAAPTPAQAAAASAICDAVRRRRAAAFLLDGVTGAGRTAVYAAAIEAAIAEGRGALVLVPEIALALPLVDRLRAGLGVDVALLHGGLAEGERADEWRRIRAGEVSVVVGTRTAVLAPLADPGVVVVDEEHEASYKSDRTPRYQARDVALEVGRLAGAPVVLGSATPDVATLGRALAGEIERLPLRDRPAGALPEVQVVDLRAELAAGNRGLLSRALARALAALDVASGERAILVINRRGSATVVLCRDCGYVQVCPECRRPLVYHAAAAALRCHHCGATAPLAARCPACGSARIRYLGGGTERLEREVRERFPALRVARLDRDVLAHRGAAARVLDGLRDGRIDVLVGTGMVAKGIDVPEVTLVGVVSADVALNLPDVRAAERTYQLLAQAVGRAGRGDRPGRACLQTYLPDHPAILAVASGEAEEFYGAELAARRSFGLPPYGRLLKLTVAEEDRTAAETRAERMVQRLRDAVAVADAGTGPGSAVDAGPGSAAGAGWAADGPGGPGSVAAPAPGHEVLGPVPAYVARRAGRWRFHVILRGPDPLRVLGRDPGPPWTVDVDPESLL